MLDETRRPSQEPSQLTRRLAQPAHRRWAKRLEQVYCQRGEIENRIKELHALQINRTSCGGFWANQFRVLLTAAAYVLPQELRLRAARTHCARAQVWTLREQLLKLGARVLVSVRRVGRAPARFVSLSTRLPYRSFAARGGERIGAYHSRPRKTPFAKHCDRRGLFVKGRIRCFPRLQHHPRRCLDYTLRGNPFSRPTNRTKVPAETTFTYKAG